MNYIVGDIGNTSTKVCILNDKFKIVRSFNFETIKIFKKNFLKKPLKKSLEQKPKFKFIIFKRSSKSI